MNHRHRLFLFYINDKYFNFFNYLHNTNKQLTIQFKCKTQNAKRKTQHTKRKTQHTKETNTKFNKLF